jgi:hypothetical protein
MKKTIFTIASIAIVSLIQSVQAQTLSDFGTSSFTMGSPFDFTPTQTATNLAFTGTDGTNSWAGTFTTPFTLSLVQSANLAINLSQTTSRTTAFTIYLVDSNNSVTNAFDASYAGVSSSPGNVLVSFNSGVSTNPTFTAGTFDLFQMSFNEGGAGATITSTAYNLNVVPEPSTYALMALGGLVLFFMVRRRKVQA